MGSEEELAGSYNWDYLLDWGPQYQPLAHVFQEISSLKDEGGSGAGGEARAPPIITCRPPRPRLFLPPSHLLPLGHHRYRRWASKWGTGGLSQGGWSAILQEEGTISLHVLPTMGTHQ